jgi:hypothetical protein
VLLLSFCLLLTPLAAPLAAGVERTARAVERRPALLLLPALPLAAINALLTGCWTGDRARNALRGASWDTWRSRRCRCMCCTSRWSSPSPTSLVVVLLAYESGVRRTRVTRFVFGMRP